MDGLVIIKEKSKNDPISFVEANIKLYSDFSNMDVSIREVNSGCHFLISPSFNKRLVEFFYIVEGSVSVLTGDESHVLGQYDSFCVSNPCTPLIVTSRLGAKILYVKNRQLYNDYLHNLSSLLNKTGEKDIYTYNHCKRVMTYSLMLCDCMNMDDHFKNVITAAALFHDIGKYYIPNEILQKPGKLTKEQFRYVMRHPLHSRMLIESQLGNDVAEIAEQHHEKLDGSGYPYGLKDNEIRLESKIIAVADVFDAMTTDRPYKKAVSYDAAVDELKSLAGIQYDSRVVEVLAEVINTHEFSRYFNSTVDETKILENIMVKI